MAPQGMFRPFPRYLLVAWLVHWCKKKACSGKHFPFAGGLTVNLFMYIPNILYCYTFVCVYKCIDFLKKKKIMFNYNLPIYRMIHSL